jgi:SNF2 family DNA or RNA helicase
MKQRHESLVDFQRLDGKPKMFVSTISSGNCGINVQSATRVYLMEPSVDPATEIQARLCNFLFSILLSANTIGITQ